MNVKYIGHDYIIDCQDYSVTILGQPVVVRHKTFQLLSALIEKPGEIVDKQTLLGEIWDDVNVDEQVIFQSIAELRKLFGNIKVIQTHPRKGYSWVADVEKKEFQSEVKTPLASQIISKKWNNRKNIVLLVGTIIVLLSAWLINSFTDSTTLSSDNKGTIFILPTKNINMEPKFDWMSVGIMDALISQAVDHTKIMTLDYVLMSMRNANMDRNYDEAQITRLSKITGADIIVESQISRRIGEYQLIYKLHYINNIKRGVLFNKSIDQLTIDLAGIIAELTEYRMQNVSINRSAFNHELFVEAITLSQQGKVSSSIELLKSLVAIEPDNIPAYKLLIDWLQFDNNFEQALVYSTAALSHLKPNDNDEISIYYRHGYNLFRLNQFEQAWQYSQLLNQNTNENNLYYQGASLKLEGEILFALNKPEKAKVAFLKALKQFEKISYSIGMTTVHCLIAEVEKSQGNVEQQQKHLQLARAVVEKYEIHDLIKSFRIQLDFP